MSEGRTRGLDRLVNFSDAVVAIASTLLILPLVELATSLGEEGPEHLTSDAWAQLFVFLLSFVVIARFWVVHHEMYEPVVDYSTALVWVNIAWLITIVFLPFPTELIVHDGHQRYTPAIYVGTMLLATVFSAAAKVLLIRTPGLLDPPQGMVALAPFIATVLLMAAAFVIALAFPAQGLYALLLLFLTAPLSALVRKPLLSRTTTPEDTPASP